MAGGTGQKAAIQDIRRGVELQATDGVALSQRLALACETPCCEVPWKIEIRGQAVVEVAEGIGREMNCGQEVLELGHFLCAERTVAALQSHEGPGELLQAGTVATPVQGLLADDVLHGLGQHGALHRVPVLTARIETVAIEYFHVPRGIAQVPGQPIDARVHVAGSAGNLPQAGISVGVVEVLAAELDGRGRGVVERHPSQFDLPRHGDLGDRALKLVQDIDHAQGLVDHHARGPLAHFNRGAGSHANGRAIEHDQVVRAHAADEGTAAQGVPGDPACCVGPRAGWGPSSRGGR